MPCSRDLLSAPDVLTHLAQKKKKAVARYAQIMADTKGGTVALGKIHMKL